jgi:mediator of RNA polymerase II transcription subunit 21
MASDILTQLQTCYDQLLTQFFSTVSYLSQRHPLAAPQPIPGDPYTTFPEDVTASRPGNEDVGNAGPYPLLPVSPETFERAQRELAEDLVRKGQQIEYLIERLPGLDRNEEEQAKDIRKKVEELKQMEILRKQKRKEMRECLRQLDEVVMGMAHSIDIPAPSTAATNGASYG